MRTLRNDTSRTGKRHRVLAVGFSPKEIHRLSGQCKNAEFLSAGSVSHVRELAARPEPADLDLVLVSTAGQDDRDSVMECMELRDQKVLSGVPLIAAVSRYQLDVGHQVSRLHQSDFLIKPIEGPELSQKMMELRKRDIGSSSRPEVNPEG
jgi:hypothetical protein